MTEFKRVFVDTAPIIYYLENSPLYSEVIKRFPLYDNGRFEITNSKCNIEYEKLNQHQSFTA